MCNEIYFLNKGTLFLLFIGNKLKISFEWNNDEIILMRIEFVFSRIRNEFSKGKGDRL